MATPKFFGKLRTENEIGFPLVLGYCATDDRNDDEDRGTGYE